MTDEPAPIAERGLLVASAEVWNLAVRRAEVIGPLARAGVVGLAAADAAAAELDVSRRQVYLLLRRWREGEGVVSDLIPRQSSGGRGREHLPPEAAQRLLAGSPQRSNGKLTVATLAVEAGVPRHRLYAHHTTLIAEFQTAAGSAPVSPTVQALQQQLADAHEHTALLQADNTRLQARIRTLCAVVAELTHEAHADNLVTMPRRRRTIIT